MCTRISSSSAGLLGQDAAPQERPPVQRHRGTVQLDRAQDRRLAHRDQAALPCQPEQHRVHRLRIAEQVLGQPHRVQVDGRRRVGGALDRAPVQHRVDQQIGVVLERGGGGEIQVADHRGGRRVALQHAGPDANREIGRDHHIGGAQRNAHDIERGLVIGDLHMRDHGAVLLRQPGEVERAHHLAFEMRRHRQDRTRGDDAAAADAGEQRAPGLRGGRG